MGAWSIEPTYGVIDNGNGNYTFIPPAEGQTVYTITYTEGEISGQIQYVVKSSDCQVDYCINDLYPPTIMPNYIENFPSEGGNTAVTWYNDDCWELTNIMTNGLINGTPTYDNPSIITLNRNGGSEEVHSTATYYFYNQSNGKVLPQTVEIVQEFDGCITDEIAPLIGPTDIGITNERTIVNIYVSEKPCWELISVEPAFDIISSEAVESISDDGTEVIIKENDSGKSRIIYVNYKFKNSTNGITTTRKLTITQETNCGCINITYYAYETTTFSGRTIQLGTFTIGNECDGEDVSIEIVGTPKIIKPDTIRIIPPSPSSPVYYTISVEVNENRSTTERTDNYKLKYGNTICDTTYSLTQNGRECNCNSITYIPITEVTILEGDICQLGTYTIDGQCSSSNINIEINNSNGVLDANNIVIWPDGKIYAGVLNTAPTETKTATYYLTYNNVRCNNGVAYEITQEKDCIYDEIAPLIGPTDVSITNERTTVEMYVAEKDCWELISVEPGLDIISSEAVESISEDGTEVIIKENDSSQSRVIYVNYKFKNSTNDMVTTRKLTITQEGTGCNCNCTNVVKVTNENNDQFYTYTTTQDETHSLTNVPFAILTAEYGATCEITANKASDAESQSGITSISCIRYVSTDTKWSEDLKDKCNTLEQNKDVYIIYGSLTATDHSRALGFTYTVCNNECKDHDGTTYMPYYIFQRCACGMDNCRNEYGTIIEDRPLFLNEEDCGWLQVDSICVETLSCVTAYYYTRTFSGDQDITNDTNATESAKQQVYTGGTIQIRSENGLNEAYIQDDIDNYDSTKSLTLHSGVTGNQIFSLCTMYTSPASPYFPLASYLYYVCLAEKIENVEQVWEITFATNSNTITGGDDNGKCALNQFTVTVYKAPKGWNYTKEFYTRDNKRGKIKCSNENCGCEE